MLARVLAILLLSASVLAAQAIPNAAIDALEPRLEPVYTDIHSHPERSAHEQRTAAKLAEDLRQLGYDVTTGVGGNGVVGILKNGVGPTP